MGEKRYEIKDHLGNVRAVTSDIKNASNYSAVVSSWRFLADIKSMSNYFPYGLKVKEGSWSASNYQFAYNGKQEEVFDKDFLHYGARQYNSKLNIFITTDPKETEYNFISPYAYALNNPVNAIDPDGRAVVFINGYRPFRLDYRNSNLYENDYYEYWNNFDNYFMNRLGDFNATYASGHDAPLGDAQTRYETGIKAANNYIKKIKSGEIKFAETETIKIVTHSQGYAYGVGFAETLINAGYNVESFYAFAPKDPRQFSIPEEIGIAKYYRSKNDFIAFQLGGLRHGKKELIPIEVPKKDIWFWNGNGHMIDLFRFVIEIPEGNRGSVEKRKDIPNSEQNNNKKHEPQLGPYRAK